MKAKRIGLGRAGLAGVTGVAVLSAIALATPPPRSPLSIRSAGHTYLVPQSADVMDTLLPDGRTFEVHGAESVGYLVDGNKRQPVKLPEARRFGSVTVMPGGEVLLWGGIDSQGHVLENGEWFNPATRHFVRTGALGLPARAGHTLTVLTDGRVLMTGGWSTDGAPATTAVVWQPQTHQVMALNDMLSSRLNADASLQSDGSVAIQGGVNEHGLPVPTAWRYDPASSHWSAVAKASQTASSSLIAATLPGKDNTAASIHGPLVVRFAAPVDLRQLKGHAVTLLGPEGTVPVDVVGAEGGRLAFVQLPDDLYPGSRYTLFVKGLRTAAGGAVPYTAVGFTTASRDATGVVVAGQGARPAANLPTSSEPSSPPLYVMAGGGRASCSGELLCRPRSLVRDGA